MTQSFWETKSLTEMSLQEWESLCDRCGKCCLHKIEDEDTGEIFFTNVVCNLFDFNKGACTQYRLRRQLVPDCMDLKEKFPPLDWLPFTCAYRLVAEGKPLPDWHPLVCQNPKQIQEAGVSIRSYAVYEKDVDAIEDHVLEDFK
ncbi:MAG: hypothetical protein AXA67_06440 [Methylothermaceae bacteria B42]|nr:MAG: hypothetical protein AXA67_06440 [Methylothermaceae bacteria B42]HHJ39822.1 YcgN family cysteine cluster protein [Methylothermaceae bacterium]